MLRYLTAGESHGPAITAILEGLPAGLPVSAEEINIDLKRRQGGYGRGRRMQIETDTIEITGGVRHGKTMGGPLSLRVENQDWKNWNDVMAVEPVNHPITRRRVTKPRPGHADLAGGLKYGHRDLRNVLERASARETAARVAAGAVSKRLLEEFDIKICSRVTSISDVNTPQLREVDWDIVEASEVRAADTETDSAFRSAIDKAKAHRTTAGGVFEVVAFGVPVGLGSYIQWDRKLDGRIAQSMMSINAVKGVEIGHGFSNTQRPGHDVHDIVVPDATDPRRFKRLSNEAGGIEGGISNGEPIVVRVAIKPIATMTKPLPSVDINTGEVVEAPYHRSDICQVPPACVIGEAMMALILAHSLLEKFGGDRLDETKRNYKSYLASHQEFGQSVS